MSTVPRRGLLAAALPAAVLPVVVLIAGPLAAPAQAGPVVCTTTLEAPPPGAAAAEPMEITRCGSITTAPQLMEARFFRHTAPYARGVSITNQITDLLGIAMGGREGNRLMGFGFPDQTIVWDGTAVENTANFLLDQQSDPMPLRTPDISSGFSGSLGDGVEPLRVERSSGEAPQSFSMQNDVDTWSAPVRGLW